MKLVSKSGYVAVGMLLLLTSACHATKGPMSANGLTSVHFDFDQASLRPDMTKVLDSNAQYLNNHKAVKITVEGSCDERGTNEYNLALGDRRAKTGADYLTHKGVSRNRLGTISYGEEKPADRGHSEAAWYKNRRDDFVRQ